MLFLPRKFLIDQFAGACRELTGNYRRPQPTTALLRLVREEDMYKKNTYEGAATPMTPLGARLVAAI
jgi:hypothetical protein